MTLISSCGLKIVHHGGYNRSDGRGQPRAQKETDQSLGHPAQQERRLLAKVWPVLRRRKTQQVRQVSGGEGKEENHAGWIAR